MRSVQPFFDIHFILACALVLLTNFFSARMRRRLEQDGQFDDIEKMYNESLNSGTADHLTWRRYRSRYGRTFTLLGYELSIVLSFVNIFFLFLRA
jgi:hypothetical protein